VAQPLEAFRNAFKIPELKQRMLFTLVMLAIYRLGAHIPAPGVDGQALAKMMAEQGGLLQFYDLFSGGAFSNATVFALGIMPYISASIIMQLLVPVVPALEKLQREGAEGQKKITEWTRYGTVVLCIVQSIGIAIYLEKFNSQGQQIVSNPGPWFWLLCIITFTTGTAFIMWLGEQVSEFGVGNGISLIIFISIISGMPNAVVSLISLVFIQGEMSPVMAVLLLFLMVAVVAGVIVITTGQRRVPIQYPRQVKGRRVYQGQRNYLPLKVNQAGVIPIIFASALLMLPGMLNSAIAFDPMNNFFARFFNQTSVLYNAVYILLIIFFTFFYTATTFNPVEMAENLKKNGSVIMGVRPGKATADYLNHVMTRITFVGALFLAGVALLPQLVYYNLGVIDWNIATFFGGTSLLILVGVALDTVRQIEQHLVMRNYDGFMKGRRVRGRR
jgi:preprotein translocase subunit SecY